MIQKSNIVGQSVKMNQKTVLGQLLAKHRGDAQQACPEIFCVDPNKIERGSKGEGKGRQRKERERNTRIKRRKDVTKKQAKNKQRKNTREQAKIERQRERERETTKESVEIKNTHTSPGEDQDRAGLVRARRVEARTGGAVYPGTEFSFDRRIASTTVLDDT